MLILQKKNLMILYLEQLVENIVKYKSIKVLQAAQNTVDKFIDYFNNIDPEERDPQTGKPIYKVKDIMAEISSLDKVLEELKTLTDQVKKDISAKSKIRAGATEGFMPTY